MQFARTGTGFDAHRLVRGRKLIVGGVEIPYYKGLEGHSDADVLCHAIMDALLGACALGDIGMHFPDSDEAYKGAESILLLRRTADLARKAGFEIGNIDATIIAQKPLMRPYIPLMRENIARAAGIGTDCVGIKATTTEWLGFAGRGEGIAAFAGACVYFWRE